MKEIKYLILIIFIFGGLVLTNFVFAQEEKTGLSISPVTFELTANPGDVLDNKIKVFNPTNSVIGVKMEVEDFTVAGEMGEVRVEPAGIETYSLAKWIKTEPTEFSLEPGEQKFVDFIIEVPENAEPGGKYGSVLATTTGVISPGGSGPAIAQKVGSLILLAVSGQVAESLNVKEFLAPSFLETGPVIFTTRFENQGTIHLRPRGFITINNWRDKKVADVEFSQLNVIPGAVRKIETTWNKKWLFGKYTAMVVGSYGSNNLPISSEVLSFWVFPWKIAITVFLVLLVILIFFYKSRRRWQLALRILIKGEQNRN
jgi:hypothetical protein